MYRGLCRIADEYARMTFRTTPSNMPTYEVYYSDRGDALVLKADLDLGWDRSPKKHGFWGNAKIDFRGDSTIRAQLRITPSPIIVRGEVPEFPLGKLDWDSSEFIHYSLRDRVLEMKVALVKEQCWKMMTTGRPGLHIRETPFLDIDATLQFNLEALVVFYSPRVPVRDVKEWGQKMFVSGGQFESDRRRH